MSTSIEEPAVDTEAETIVEPMVASVGEDPAVHAKRSFPVSIMDKAAAILDAAIDALPKLRKSTGGASATGNEGELEEMAGQPAATPAPRRIRAVLIYLGVLIVGGAGGGAIVYELLSSNAEQHSTETHSTETAAASDVKASSESGAKTEEKKPEVSHTESAKPVAESQAGLKTNAADAAQKPVSVLASVLAEEKAEKAAPVQANGATAAKRPLKSGDCKLAGGDIAALKDCVEKFNR